MTEREQLHFLIDELAETELSPAMRFLEFLRAKQDEGFHELHETAPWDDEPLTPEDRQAIEEGLAEQAAGLTRSHTEIRARWTEDLES